MSLRLRATACLALTLLVGSCGDGDSPMGAGRGAGVAIGFQPALIPTPADAGALPINRIRVRLARVSDGLQVAATSVDVDPSDDEWSVDLNVPGPSATATVHAFVHLLNVAGDGTESVQFSGRSDPIELRPDETASPDVPVVRGPVDNLFTTGVTITSAPATLAEGANAVLVADVTTSGIHPPTVFWTSLDPAVVALAGDTATAAGGGTAQVVASAGTFADTVTISVIPALSVTTTSLPGGTVDAPYIQTLAATGGDGSYAWALSAGALPAGLDLAAASGVISGTPTGVGTADFTVQVSSAGLTATRALSITIASAGRAGMTVSESEGSTTVDESGTTDTFVVVLDAQPATDVRLNVVSGDPSEATVTPGVLTFTTANWSDGQTVTVTGVDDAVVDGNQVTEVTISVDDAASDDEYDDVVDQTVIVTTIDDDVGGGLAVRWATAVSGDWSTGSNWTGGSAPAVGDSVVIDVPGTYSVNLDGDVQIRALNLGGASGAQTLSVVGGQTLTVDDVALINANGIVDLTDGTLDGSGSYTNDGIVRKTAGAATSSIAAPFANDGLVDVAVGRLELLDGYVHQGSFTIGADAALVMFQEDVTLQTDTIRGTITGPGVLDVDIGNNGLLWADDDIDVGSVRILSGGLYLDETVAISDSIRVTSGRFDARLPATIQIPYLFSDLNSASCCSRIMLEVTDSMHVAGGYYYMGLDGFVRTLPGVPAVYAGGVGPRYQTDVELQGPTTLGVNVGLQGGGSFELLPDAAMTVTGARSFTSNAGGGTVRFHSGATVTGPDFWGITSGNPLQNDGLVVMRGGQLRPENGFTHTAGAVLQGFGTLELRFNTGATAIDGDIVVGDSIGTLTVQGSLSQGATSTIEVELGGTTPGTGHDQLVVSDTLTLAGDLVVDTIAGFAPVGGDRFPVLVFGQRLGGFTSVTLPTIDGLTMDTVWAEAGTVDTLFVVAVDVGAGPASARTGNHDVVSWSDIGPSDGEQQAGDSVVVGLDDAFAVSVDVHRPTPEQPITEPDSRGSSRPAGPDTGTLPPER